MRALRRQRVVSLLVLLLRESTIHSPFAREKMRIRGAKRIAADASAKTTDDGKRARASRSGVARRGRVRETTPTAIRRRDRTSVGYLIERGRCLSRLTTSHHTLLLAYRRVSLSSLCVPCCGWRLVSECTPLLLSRQLLFKYVPLPCCGWLHP
ncbi:hypothetical protein PUN28_009314 [Cardiocondyla obscurior]|uniref:Secreted protein n=1 Tax=Cardiocondyla obscurior TaxID=286306 RepID=A0AAW2FUR8_9HYME